MIKKLESGMIIITADLGGIGVATPIVVREIKWLSYTPHHISKLLSKSVQELSSKQLEGVMQYKEDQERRKLLEKYLKNKCTKSEKEEVFYDRIDIDRIADDKLTKSEKEEIESKFKDYRYLINGNGSEEEKENLNTYIQLKEKKIEEREMWEDYLVYLIEKYDSDRHMAYLDRDIRIECEKNADMRRRSLEIAEHSYMK